MKRAVMIGLAAVAHLHDQHKHQRSGTGRSTFLLSRDIWRKANGVYTETVGHNYFGHDYMWPELCAAITVYDTRQPPSTLRPESCNKVHQKWSTTVHHMPHCMQRYTTVMRCCATASNGQQKYATRNGMQRQATASNGMQRQTNGIS